MRQSPAYRYSAGSASEASYAPPPARIAPWEAAALGVVLVVAALALREERANERAILACPEDASPARYGSLTYLDGIRIEGSPAFVGRTVHAIQRVWHTPSYRYVRKIKSITERKLSGSHAQIHISSRRVESDPTSAARGCTIYGGTLVHEGAHVVYGPEHKEVYAAHAQALREMGEASAAVWADFRSATSWSNGYGERRRAWR